MGYGIICAEGKIREVGNIHVIIGEDDYLVSQAAAKTVGDGIGLEVVDSANSGNEDLQLADIRRAEESLMTPPFLDPKKVTWWKNVKFLPGGKAKSGDEGGGRTAESVKTALEKFAKRLAAANLPPNQHFILSAPKLLQTSIFAKTLKQTAEVVVFETPKNAAAAVRDAVPRVEELAAEMGLSFERGAAEAFVAKVGPDTRSLISELAKMRDYLGDGSSRITGAAIAEVSSPGVGVEPELWSVTDAAAARDLAGALKAVSGFEGDDSYAIVITTVLEKCFRQLAELKDAQERGKLGEATASMNRWAAEKATRNLDRWRLNELRLARKRFLDLRVRAVSGASEAGCEVAIELVRTLGGGMKKGGVPR